MSPLVSWAVLIVMGVLVGYAVVRSVGPGGGPR